MKANAWSRNGEYRRALKTLLDVAARQRGAADRIGLANTLQDAANTYRRIGLPDSSLVLIDSAHTVLRSAVDTQSLDYAYFLNDIGSVYYQADRLDEAERFWLRNIELLHAHGQRNTQRLGYVYDNIANIYTTRGERDKVLDYRQKALAISKALGNDLDHAVTLYNLGIFHFTQGNFGTAAQYVNTALEMRERIVGVGHPSLINSYHAQGVLQSMSGNDDLALAAFHRLARLVRNSGGESDQLARFYDEIGGAHRRMGRLDSAAYYQTQALRIFRANAGGGSNPQAIALYNHSITLAELGRPEEALAAVRKGMDIMAGLGLADGPDFVQYRASQIIRLIEASRLDEARPLLAAAIESLREGEGFLLTPTAADALGQLTEAGYAFYSADPSPENLRLFRDLERDFMDVTETIRRQFYDPYTKGTLNRQRAGVLEENVDRYAAIFTATGDPAALDRLFELSELSKATAIRDQLRTGVNRFAGMPDSLLSRGSAYQETIEELYYGLQDAAAGQADSLRAELLTARRGHDEFLRMLTRDHPNYANLVAGRDIVARPQVQRELGKQGQTAVIYLKGAEAYYALILSSGGFRLARCAGVERVDDAVRAWRKGLGSVLTAEHLSAGHDLYQALWAPAAPHIHTKRIKVIPAGAVSSVSFDALSKAPDEPAYLLRDHVISYVYSWNLYQHQRGGRLRTGAPRILAMAPGFFGSSSAGAASGVARVSQPYATDLVRQMGRRFAGSALLGASASEADVRQRLPASNLLLFATHGFVDAATPLRSGLELAPAAAPENDARESDDDGFLTVAEIFNTRIAADLSILSLCESGIGQITPGEGMMSLAYGFSYAGCASTTNTLWKVDDEANSRLTAYLIEELAAGKDRAAALREAKLRYLENAPAELTHPYYWGAMVMQGKDGPVALTTRSRGWWVYALSGLLGVLASLWILKSVRATGTAGNPHSS